MLSRLQQSVYPIELYVVLLPDGPAPVQLHDGVVDAHALKSRREFQRFF